MLHRVVESPVGPLTLIVDADGALAGLTMADEGGSDQLRDLGEPDDSLAQDDSAASVGTAESAGTAESKGPLAAGGSFAADGSLAADDSLAQDAVDQLAEYFEGRRTAFDLRLAPRGTDFQRRVWDALTDIGYGETESYGHLAERIGSPRGTRAVGAAARRNPIGIIIPCHRLVGSKGELTGYAGGLDRKRFLLDLERGGRLL